MKPFFSIFLLTLSGLLLLSCQKNTSHEDDLNIQVICKPQDCKYVDATNYHYTFIPDAGGYPVYHPIESESESELVEDFRLGIAITDHETLGDRLYSYGSADNYRGDPEIETILKSYFLKELRYLKEKYGLPTGPDQPGYYATLKRIPYRDKAIKDFSIRADKTLFGQPAGTVLNEYFEISGCESNAYIMTPEKKIVDRISWHLSIKKYLAYNPLAAPFIYLRMLGTPPEVPLPVSFTIEITFDDRVLKTSSPVIILTR